MKKDFFIAGHPNMQNLDAGKNAAFIDGVQSLNTPGLHIMGGLAAQQSFSAAAKQPSLQQHTSI